MSNYIELETTNNFVLRFIEVFPIYQTFKNALGIKAEEDENAQVIYDIVKLEFSDRNLIYDTGEEVSLALKYDWPEIYSRYIEIIESEYGSLKSDTQNSNTETDTLRYRNMIRTDTGIDETNPSNREKATNKNAQDTTASLYERSGYMTLIKRAITTLFNRYFTSSSIKEWDNINTDEEITPV